MYAAGATIGEPQGATLGSAGGTGRNVFGDAALFLFLLAQALDGALTYVGVSTYGMHMEGNPLIGWLMAAMGHGPALATAKVTAGGFGIALHLSQVHKAVAFLAIFYVIVAIFPWLTILYLTHS